MATTITIQVGALNANRTFANDAKATTVLLEFYIAQELGPLTATNKQKLEAIIDWLVGVIAGTAQVRRIKLAKQDAREQIEEDYKFE